VEGCSVEGFSGRFSRRVWGMARWKGSAEGCSAEGCTAEGFSRMFSGRVWEMVRWKSLEECCSVEGSGGQFGGMVWQMVWQKGLVEGSAEGFDEGFGGNHLSKPFIQAFQAGLDLCHFHAPFSKKLVPHSGSGRVTLLNIWAIMGI